MKSKALTIAGSDNSGGAGIQGDLKTFESYGVHGLSTITAITAQNSKGVINSWPVSSEAVYKQIITVHEDIKIDAVKIGVLVDLSILKAVCKAISLLKNELSKTLPVVLDPVLISSSGYKLLEFEGIKYFKKNMIPLCTIITPNLLELEILSGIKPDSLNSIKAGVKKIINVGAANVILKGGHREGNITEDFFHDGDEFIPFSSKRIQNKEVHGTGCIFSSALTANLALGKNLIESITEAKKYITEVISKAKLISKDPTSTTYYAD